MAVAGSVLPLVVYVHAAPSRPRTSPKSTAETAVKRFYDSLKDEQKKVICFPFDHPLRTKINANWAITKPTIDDYFTKDQQATPRRDLPRRDQPRRLRPVQEADGRRRRAASASYHVAVFGTPGSGQFEWEMTGRHVTIRADGDSVANAAFGGPIVYGHGEGDSKKGLPGNVFYYQTKKANEVFSALDGKQRKKALLPKAPKEDAVQVQGSFGARSPASPSASSPRDQKELVESVMKVILAPYREEDVNEALAILKDGGGLDAPAHGLLRVRRHRQRPEWDIWRLEGPTFVWHFRALLTSTLTSTSPRKPEPTSRKASQGRVRRSSP